MSTSVACDVRMVVPVRMDGGLGTLEVSPTEAARLRARRAEIRYCERCDKPFVGGSAARFCPSCRYIGRTGDSRKAKYVWTPDRDEALRARYDGRVPGRAAEIAASFGWPGWVVKHRAALLGIARPKPAKWSQEEIDFLLEHTGTRTVLWMAKRLHRTTTAVVVKLKRLHLSRRIDHGGYGLLDLAEAFGCDHHSVDAWIRRGWLQGRGFTPTGPTRSGCSRRPRSASSCATTRWRSASTRWTSFGSSTWCSRGRSGARDDPRAAHPARKVARGACGRSASPERQADPVRAPVRHESPDRGVSKPEHSSANTRARSSASRAAAGLNRP